MLFKLCIITVVFQSLEMNWRTGKHTLQKIVCRSENIKGVYCLQYDEQKIVSGLRDNTIKVEFLFIALAFVQKIKGICDLVVNAKNKTHFRNTCFFAMLLLHICF